MALFVCGTLMPNVQRSDELKCIGLDMNDDLELQLVLFWERSAGHGNMTQDTK